MKIGARRPRALLALAAGLPAWGCTPAAPAGQGGSAWVGTRHPPPPASVVIERGTTLGPADTARYAIAEVVAEGERLLWLSRRAGETGAAAAWTVADVLVVALEPGEVLALALCARVPPGGEPVPDPELVAVARAGAAAVLADVRRAWRANRSTGRFEPVAAGGVACLDEAAPEP